MIEGRHYQNAYVTRDVDAAVESFRRVADLRREDVFEVPVDIRTPAGPATMRCKLAFLWVEDLQYELIQPIDGAIDIYTDVLPDDGALRFHHACMRVSEWDGLRERLEQRGLPVVLEGDTGALQFLFVDARPLVGHYLEFTFMSDEMWGVLGGR